MSYVLQAAQACIGNAACSILEGCILALSNQDGDAPAPGCAYLSIGVQNHVCCIVFDVGIHRPRPNIEYAFSLGLATVL